MPSNNFFNMYMQECHGYQGVLRTMSLLKNKQRNPRVKHYPQDPERLDDTIAQAYETTRLVRGKFLRTDYDKEFREFFEEDGRPHYNAHVKAALSYCFVTYAVVGVKLLKELTILGGIHTKQYQRIQYTMFYYWQSAVQTAQGINADADDTFEWPRFADDYGKPFSQFPLHQLQEMLSGCEAWMRVHYDMGERE